MTPRRFTMSDDNSDPPATPPRKKLKVNKGSSRQAAQKFRDTWLSQSDFKHWLERNPNDPFKAKCKKCNSQMTADLWVLKNHVKSQKHILNCSSSQSVYPKAMDFFSRGPSNSTI